MMNRIRVNLNAIEQGLVFEVAGARQRAREKDNKRNSTYGAESAIKKHIDGIAGEIAFGKAVDKYPDLEIYATGVNHGPDFHLLGAFWDIKTTRHKNGKLINPMSKDTTGNWADVYVLVISEFPKMTIVGWAYANDLRDSVMDLGNGPVYGLTQAELKPIDFHWVDERIQRSPEMEWI
jgi:hypothetical protein